MFLPNLSSLERITPEPDGNITIKKKEFFSFTPAIIDEGNLSSAIAVTLLHPPARKRGPCKPAILTGFFPVNTRIFSKYPLFGIFFTGDDA